jgi:hypothetical protein
MLKPTTAYGFSDESVEPIERLKLKISEKGVQGEKV